MSTISYLTLCKYINCVKKTEYSLTKTSLMVELTSLVNWSVEHEEIDSIPISESTLTKINRYLPEENELVSFSSVKTENTKNEEDFNSGEEIILGLA